MILVDEEVQNKKLSVVEIFYSLQGEGLRAGTQNIFVRLSGCNLACWFCDTDFSKGIKKTISGILNEIKEFPCRNIIWTGGEPCLQLDNEIVYFFKNEGYYQAIETNGCREVPQGIDFITCSPKKEKNAYVEAKNNYSLMNRVDEYKFPIVAGEEIEIEGFLPGKQYLISPIFDDKELNRKNLDYCVEYVKKNSKFRLSMQQHKIWGVR